MVDLPDDAIEKALVEGFGQARWDAMNGAEQHDARELFGPMAVSIAARVRAEAQPVVASVEVAAARNPLLGTLYLHESLDFSRELVGAFERAVRAEAVAAERQRIAALIREHAGPEVSEGVCAGVQRWPAERARGYTAAINEVIEEVLDAAAGSVPVATPGSTEWAHVVAMPGQLTDKTLLEVLGLTDAEQAEVRERLRAELDAIDRAERGISSGGVATGPAKAMKSAARGYGGDPVATPEPKAVLGPGTIVRRVATPTEPALTPDDCTCEDDGGCVDYYDEDRPGDCAYCQDPRFGVNDGAACPAITRQPSGDREAFDRRAGGGEAAAELLGHRLTVGEAVPAEQPEER